MRVEGSAGRVCYSYLVHSRHTSRKFLPEKARAIEGLIPAQHYKLLIGGQNVTLENGTVVTPDQVCLPPPPLQCFAFIFLPDVSFLADFLKNFENTIFDRFSDANIDR